MHRTAPIPFINQATTDPDADAFIAAAQLTDSTQQQAVQQLVADLKNASIWSKLVAVYPLVGGNSSAHKFNLKDPRPVAEAFCLQFINSPAHTATGVKWDGSSQYATTFLIPAQHLPAGQGSHVGYYSRDGNIAQGDPLDMGAHNNGGQSIMLIGHHPTGGAVARHCSNYAVHPTTKSGRGFYLSSNEDLTQASPMYENGQRIGYTPQGGALPTLPVFLGALNLEGNPYGYVPRECAFASIGSNLTEAEAAAYYTIVQTFQTTLNRAV